jgi:O-antigen/teichoic acid export membrane protein
VIDNRKNSYLKRFLSGGLWTLAGTGVSKVLTLVLMALLARMLGAEKFGEVGILQSTLATIGTFAGFGLSNTALRYVAKYKFQEPVRLGRIIGVLTLVAISFGLAACISILAIAPWLGTVVLQAPDLISPLRMGSPLLLFSLLSGIQNGTIIGFQNFRGLAILNLLDGVLGIVLTLILVTLFKLEGFAVALVLKTVGVWLAGKYFVKKDLRRNAILAQWRQAWYERQILLGFSLPAFLSSIFYAPVMWIGKTLLARNSGYNELGLFIAATQINLLVTAVITVFAQVSTSMLSESFNDTGSTDTYNRRFNLTLRFNLNIANVVGFVLCLWPAGLTIIFGAHFSQATAIIPLTVAFAVANVGCATCGQYFSSSGHMWLGFLMTLLWGVLFLSFFVLFFVGAGGKGLSMSLLVSYSLVLACQLIIIRKRQGQSILNGLVSSYVFFLLLAIVAYMLAFPGMEEVARFITVLGLIGLTARVFVFDSRVVLGKTREILE